MTKVNPNIGNETKSDIFPWDIFKYDIILKSNFKILWLNQTQAMEMKQNQTFHMGYIEIWDHFLLGAEYWNISMTSLIDIFQFGCKS